MKRVDQALALLDEAYAVKAWHGPNFKGSIRGVDPETARWRPAPGRHNIWEIVVHAAYWKYAVRRRLSREKRGSFALKGSNWFPRGEGGDAAVWKADLELLDEQHRLLRGQVSLLKDADLVRPLEGKNYGTLWLVEGCAHHDIYHAGQIQLLKRLAHPMPD